MKKTFLRIVAVVMTMIMLVSALPMNTFAVEETEIESTGNDVSVNTTSEFGEMIASELDEVEADPDAPYYISDLEFEDGTAKVNFYNEAECKLVVAVYEEETMKMVSSQMADVDEEVLTTSLEFEDELPGTFIAKAYLLGSNNEGLCKAFTSTKNTAEYQEFISKTTEDFSENIVINLDESVDNNFLVMNDNGQTVTGDSDTNVLVSQDLETNTYVFENIDDNIKNLKSGDIFYLDNGDEENIVVIKVSSIEIDGTTATIISETVELEDVFDYVKIDSECLTAEFEYNPEGKDPDVEYLGEDTSVNPSGAVSEEETFDFSKKYKIGEKKFESADGSGEVVFGCTLTFNVNCTFKIYVSGDYKEVSLVVTPSVAINASVTGKIDTVNISLGGLDASPVPGLFIGIKPTFVVRVSGEISVSGTLQFAIGAGWTSDEGFVNKCEKPSFKPELNVEASIFIGFDIKPRIYFASEKALKLELSSVVGAEITAKYDETSYTNVDGINHSCSNCIDGDIDGKLEVTAKVVVGEDTWIEKEAKVKLVNLTVEICEFYYSITYSEFAFSSCPHKLLRVTFNVTDNEGNPVSGASVMETTTDSTGVATLYLKDGKYSYTVTSPSNGSFSGKFTVNGAVRTINVTLGRASSGGLTGNEQQGDIIEFGSYPQTEVTGYTLKTNLNLLDKTWYSYDYYINGEQSDFMKYTDVEYNGEKYRGVKFTYYRPFYTSNSSSASSSYQDENGYRTSTTYWFKYEPLKWRVLSPEDGIVMCESIIDSQPFHYTQSSTNGYYANNYAESSIRKWLLNDFYNLAFTESEKSLIGLTTCPNYCPYNGYTQYDAEETIDKIFLLSYDEVLETELGFPNTTSSSSARVAQGTDYAKCQGLYVDSYTGNSLWLLRSPPNNDEWVFLVYIDGQSDDKGSANYSSWGVRPAFRFDMESVNFESYDEEIGSNGAIVNIPATHFDASEDSCVAGNDYMLLNVTDYSEEFTLSTENLLFIDQVTADESGKVDVSFLPKTVDKNSTTLLVGDFGEGVETKILDAHSYSKAITEPTCTESGFTTYTCTLCGDSYTDDVTPALGHSWSEWETTLEPTLTTDGAQSRGCSVCSATEENILPKTGIQLTVTDSEGNVIKEEVVEGDITEYTFTDLADGEYTLTVQKSDYVTREYQLTSVEGEAFTEIKLNRVGDINGDGKISVLDYTAVLKHVKKTKALDGYEFACSDVNGDGKVTLLDYTAVLKHVKKTSSLW